MYKSLSFQLRENLGLSFPGKKEHRASFVIVVRMTGFSLMYQAVDSDLYIKHPDLRFTFTFRKNEI